MKLVVGLGNPGRAYAEQRHNVGFRIAQAFAARAGIALDAERFAGRFGEGCFDDARVGILLPLTMMNASGRAVAQALQALPVAAPDRDLLLLLDDMDLPFGRLRLRAQGSDAGHRGLRDVLARTACAVPRLRFGVGRPGASGDTRDFVLEPFRADERAPLEAAVTRAADAVACWITEGMPTAMRRFNGAATS